MRIGAFGETATFTHNYRLTNWPDRGRGRGSARRGKEKVEPMVGVEPTTYGLRIHIALFATVREHAPNPHE